MDRNDPNYPIPIGKLREHGYPCCRSRHYDEVKAGRLVVTKSGNRNFVLKKDADAWLATLPRVAGKAGDIALKVAEQKLKELGAAVAKGLVARALVTERLSAAAARAGLKVNTEQHTSYPPSKFEPETQS
jgi:hypothetical protein